MASNQSREFTETLRKNELDANKSMAKVCLFAAFSLVIVWALYIAKVFLLDNYTLIHIFMPIDIALLVAPIALSKTKLFQHPGFKYFMIFGLLLVICILNVVIPKHTMVAYALVLILACHYYSPKMGWRVFGVTLPMMLLCMYGGMFLGEYDTNLMTPGAIRLDEAGQPYIYQPETPRERFEFLHELLLQGQNRYWTTFAYYFVPRAIILTLVCFACQGLDKRTYSLLRAESDSRIQKETIQTELRIASEIQSSSLPRPFANTDDVEILAELIPAKEVGGDLYDYVVLDDTHIAFLIGDVSGKSTPGAMWMMKTVTCLEDMIRVGKKPSQILSEVNEVLSRHNESATFVTCFLGILDTKTGILTYSNAGHNPPILKRGGRALFLPVSSGMVLGGGSLCHYRDENIRLLKEDVIMLYTDGLTEARDKDGGFYGEKRLLSFIGNSRFTSLMHLHYELQDEMFNYMKGAEQADDLTYLFLQYQGDKVNIRELECNATMEETPKVMDFAKECLKENGIEGKPEKDILLVVDEIYSNIAKYAYDEEVGTMYFRFQYNVTKKEVVLTFVDKGIDFNMIESQNELVTKENAATRKAGGLGMMLVRSFMDETAYTRLGDKNILTLRKKIE